jgi:flavin reductase (DIM6/NTAB) family NADH-FMN oxidoreductase RutF
MKKSTGPDTYLFPLPAVVVGTYDKTDTPNMMTASWTGIINSKPSMLSVSLRKATYSYNSIIERKAFTISVPSQKYLAETDYVGTKSGKNENKFETTGLTPVHSDRVDAPYVEEFPVILECRLVKYEDLGLHTLFIAEIVDVKVDQACLNPKGKPDIHTIRPVGYAHGEREYYGIGDFLGKANKLWKTSRLNTPLFTGTQKEPAELIFDYYRKLDNAEPIEAFENFFFWDDFTIDNEGAIIDSHDKYKEWYNKIQASHFDRRHIINKIKIEQGEVEDDFRVILDMFYQARSWKPGEARSTNIRVAGKIEWFLKKDPSSGRLKAHQYIVNLLK